MCPQLNTAKFHFQSQERTPIPNILYNFISGGGGHDQRAGSGTPMGRLHSLLNVIIVKSTMLPDSHPELTLLTGVPGPSGFTGRLNMAHRTVTYERDKNKRKRANGLDIEGHSARDFHPS